MDAWVAAELGGEAMGHRDLAGSLVAWRLATSLAELTIVPLLTERRALLLAPERLWLSFRDGTLIDAVGLPAPAVAVLADDPDAHRPGVTVAADDDELHTFAAEGLAVTYAGHAAAVRARAPFGLAGIWGTLVDCLANVALEWARDTDGDPDRAWVTSSSVIDALARRPEPHLPTRPRRHDVACPTGSGVFAIGGTCCLMYKTHQPAPGEPDGPHDRIAAAACKSCPLRSDEDRHARFVRFLTERAGRDAG
jgi:hypothetical protein